MHLVCLVVSAVLQSLHVTEEAADHTLYLPQALVNGITVALHFMGAQRLSPTVNLQGIMCGINDVMVIKDKRGKW